MRTSSRALIWVVLVFAAGILFGTALTLIIVRPNRSLGADIPATPPPQIDSPAESQPLSPAGPRREQLTRRLLRQLQLDATQEESVRKILEESRLRQQAVNRDRQQELVRIRRRTLREIHAVLQPEQQERLEQLLRRLNRRRQLRD